MSVRLFACLVDADNDYYGDDYDLLYSPFFIYIQGCFHTERMEKKLIGQPRKKMAEQTTNKYDINNVDRKNFYFEN